MKDPKKEMNNERDKKLERIIHLMQTDDSVDAPADAVKWSKNIFRTQRVEGRPSAAERILAVLTMDIAPGEAVFGERSGAAEARQMLFEAGDLAIDLRISPSEGGFYVRGQAIGEGFEGCDVALGPLAVKANDQAEFIFEGVDAGEYDLVIRAKGSEIAIEQIKIS